MKRSLATLLQILRNASLRQKLLVFVTVLVLLMLGVALFARYQVSVIQSRYLPLRAAVREMEVAISDMRLYEQRLVAEANSASSEFYLKRQSPNVAIWQQKFQQYEQSYSILAKGYAKTGIAKDLTVMHQTMLKYRDVFLKLEGTYHQRGFQAYGRMGALGQRSDIISEVSLTSLTAQQQRIRLLKAEQDFIFDHNPQAIQQFDANRQLLQAALTPQDRIVLEEYARLFHEIVDLEEAIGLTPEQGTRGEMARLADEVTPYAEAVERDVLEATSTSIGAIPRLIDAASVILAGVAFSAVFVFTRYMGLRLRHLLMASKAIAGGNLSHRVSVDSNDELGQLAASFNTMTDTLEANRLSLRERASELTENVRKFELVSRAVHEAIYEWNIESGELVWGEGLSTVFGYRKDTRIVPIDWWTDRMHPEDTEGVNESLNRHLQKHSSTWKAVYRFKKASGQYAYCQDRGFIEYSRGKPVRMVGSLVDITRQRQLDRAKDEFISIASHQLRTPLGSIRWNLELMAEQAAALPKEVQEFIQEAYNSTLRMLELVSDLLSVARIEQDRVKIIPTKTDLAEVINMAVIEMQPIARQRQIKIDESGLQPIEVIIDAKQFREVAQNLLSNAVKYSNAKGRVSVGIQIKNKEVIVHVSDDGIGIPAEDQASLFTKFFRAQNVTVTDTEGSGLGLFVVKSYVEAWGGRIWFESKVNQGTTFFLTVPLSKKAKKSKH